MQYGELVDHPLFRVAMFFSAVFLLWVVVAVPREAVERWRSGVRVIPSDLTQRDPEEVYEIAANARSVLPAMIAVAATAIQLLAMAVLGSKLQIEDWIYWGGALAGSAIWAVAVRQLGWPNLLVPREVKPVPGLLMVRLRGKGQGSPEKADDGGEAPDANKRD